MSVFGGAGYIAGAPPSGPVVTSATVASGSVTFESLTVSVRYVAYALGLGITFLVPSPVSSGGAGLPGDAAEGDVLAWESGVPVWTAPGTAGDVATQEELESEASTRGAADTALDGRLDTLEAGGSLATHAADTTAVHGLSNTAYTKAAAVHNGTSYPARPTGFASVEWIGPTDPGGSAVDGDTWVPTA